MKPSKESIFGALPYVKAIRAFQGVQETCFGKELREGYSDAIDHFSKAYRALNISLTPMVTKNLWKCLSFLRFT